MIGILARVVSTRGKFITRRIGEPEGLAVRANERVIERVEREISGECHGSNNIRGGNKGVSSRVGIITTGEVAVIRGYNCRRRVT